MRSSGHSSRPNMALRHALRLAAAVGRRGCCSQVGWNGGCEGSPPTLTLTTH